MPDHTQTTPMQEIAFVKDLMHRMSLSLNECADDLEAELDARYGGTQDKYPEQLRKYDRDMSVVKRARKVLMERMNAGI